MSTPSGSRGHARRPGPDCSSRNAHLRPPHGCSSCSSSDQSYRSTAHPLPPLRPAEDAGATSVLPVNTGEQSRVIQCAQGPAGGKRRSPPPGCQIQSADPGHPGISSARQPLLPTGRAFLQHPWFTGPFRAPHLQAVLGDCCRNHLSVTRTPSPCRPARNPPALPRVLIPARAALPTVRPLLTPDLCAPALPASPRRTQSSAGPTSWRSLYNFLGPPASWRGSAAPSARNALPRRIAQWTLPDDSSGCKPSPAKPQKYAYNAWLSARLRERYPVSTATPGSGVGPSFYRCLRVQRLRDLPTTP